MSLFTFAEQCREPTLLFFYLGGQFCLRLLAVEVGVGEDPTRPVRWLVLRVRGCFEHVIVLMVNSVHDRRIHPGGLQRGSHWGVVVHLLLSPMWEHANGLGVVPMVVEVVSVHAAVYGARHSPFLDLTNSF